MAQRLDIIPMAVLGRDGEGMLPVPRSCQYPNQRQGTENQKFADSSGPIFSTYSNMVEGEDIKMAKRWQKDADGVLIFVGTSVVLFHPTHPS
jgi:hypothetical protein